MLAGPIFSLETVTSTRRARYFVVRVLYAAAILVALCSVYHGWTRFGRELTVRNAAEFGAAFFQSFAVLQLVMVIGLGPGLVAGTIAQERERRTIEYLFATDLSNTEIVLGKLFARLLLLLYLVLVALPILSVAMLLGGISPTRLLLVFLMTASSMLMVAGLSMAVSVWTPRAREAVTRSYVVLLALLILPPVATAARGQIPAWIEDVLSPLVTAGLIVNPFWRLGTLGVADPVGLGGVLSAIWPLLVGQLAIGAILLAAAVWGVRRVHLRSADVPKKTAPRAWPRIIRPRMDRSPMLWKELFAERAVPQMGVFGRLVVLLIVAGILVPTTVAFVTSAGSPYPMQEFQHYAIMMGVVVGCGGLLLIGARAAGSITSEKERDTWTTLLSTPLEPDEIVTAKVLGNLYAARLVYSLLLVIWGLAIFRDPKFLFGAACSAAVLLLCSLCVSLIGLLFSCWCSTSQRAMGCTLGVLVWIGGGYMFCCLPLAVGSSGPDEIILAPCIPFLVAFPAVATVESRTPAEIVVAFILGIIGYSVLTTILWTAAVTNFNQLAGRPDGLWRLPVSERRFKREVAIRKGVE